jgi:hypothetical protein
MGKVILQTLAKAYLGLLAVGFIGASLYVLFVGTSVGWILLGILAFISSIAIAVEILTA